METWRRKAFCAVFTLLLLFLLCSCGRTGSLSAGDSLNADGASNSVISAGTGVSSEKDALTDTDESSGIDKSTASGTGQTSESPTQAEKTEKPLNDAASENGADKNGADKNNVTSLEAVKIAYAEAKKWNANAVLWFIHPTNMFLHYDWTQSDKAMSWTIGFANPDNDEYVTEDNEENWTPDRQMFEVDLIIPANKDLQKYGWQEGKNTRYVTLKRLDNSWVIEAFAFQ